MMTPAYMPTCAEFMSNVRGLAHSASRMGQDVAERQEFHGAPVSDVGRHPTRQPRSRHPRPVPLFCLEVT